MSQVQLSEQISQGQWRPECDICKEPVELEESKADEYGHAVHEECFVSKLRNQTGSASGPPGRLEKPHEHKPTVLSASVPTFRSKKSSLSASWHPLPTRLKSSER